MTFPEARALPEEPRDARELLRGWVDAYHGPVVLEELDWTLSCVQGLIRKAVDDYRLHGATWSDVGEALGMTRQAAQQRFGV